MANRQYGNVIIIDSAMGNALILTSADRVVQNREYKINAIAIYAVDTTASIALTGADTALATFFRYSFLPASGTTGGAVLDPIQNPAWFSFSGGQYLQDLKCPTVTAGTAYLYLA